MTTISTKPSPNRTKVPGKRKIRLLVIHDMEAPELDGTAEAVAAYFQKPSTKASSHECIDNNSVVVCVDDQDVAWAAPGANSDGIQFELAGYARQTKKQWGDPYSDAMLHIAARRMAKKAIKHKIKVRHVSAAELKAGGAARNGITRHVDVTNAFHQSSHTDPGPNFPLTQFIGMVRDATKAVDLSDLRDAYHTDTATKAHHPVQVRRAQAAAGMKLRTGRWRSGTKRAWTRKFGHPDPRWDDLRTLRNTKGLRIYK